MAEKNTAVVVSLVIFSALAVGTLVSWFLLSLEVTAHKEQIGHIEEMIEGAEKARKGRPPVTGLTERKITLDKDVEDQDASQQKMEQSKNETEGDRDALGQRSKTQYDLWVKAHREVQPAIGAITEAYKIAIDDPMENAENMHDAKTWTEQQWRVDIVEGLHQIHRTMDHNIKEMDRRIRELKHQFTIDRKDLQRDHDGVAAQLDVIRRRLAKQNKDWAVEKTRIKDKLAEIEERLRHEKKKIAQGQRTDIDPDGIILSAGGPGTNFAVVNLGWVHGVREGMEFDVYEQTQGGRRIPKGKIEVKTVFAQISDVMILPPKREMPVCPQCGWEAYKSDMHYCVYCFLGDNNDEVQTLDRGTGSIIVRAQNPMNPIKFQDRISNPYFELAQKPKDMTEVAWQKQRMEAILRGDQSYQATRGQRLTFVFGGETIKRSKREIKLFIQENGGVLQNKLTLNTNYLIAGTGRKAEELVQRARELGVRILKEEELGRFFGRRE